MKIDLPAAARVVPLRRSPSPAINNQTIRGLYRSRIGEIPRLSAAWFAVSGFLRSCRDCCRYAYAGWAHGPDRRSLTSEKGRNKTC